MNISKLRSQFERIYFFVNLVISRIIRYFGNFQEIGKLALSWKWRDLHKTFYFSWTGFEVCRYSLFINGIFLSKHSEDLISKLAPRIPSYSPPSRASGSWFVSGCYIVFFLSSHWKIGSWFINVLLNDHCIIDLNMLQNNGGLNEILSKNTIVITSGKFIIFF